MWRASVHPFVLPTEARRGGVDRFDLARLSPLARLLRSPSGAEHLLLSDGLRCLRIDIRCGTVSDGAVRLHYRLSGLSSLEPRLLTLRRLVALWKLGRFSSRLHPVEARAPRWIMQLRAHDALAAGASQGEIAEQLLGLEGQRRRWRIEHPDARARAQRLVRSARFLARGGYRAFLQPHGGSARAD
ncbi:DNA -binding domain-containing protein [Sphingosinicella terrae]|uniref:DNA -binding domain-containing protein n=1 Tax=Sphingosinicella terrae TaxID=2172047 RepID=UPI0013B409E9|nr:DUF2285 domain-containing protein [Sphingosinicella terrae]